MMMMEYSPKITAAQLKRKAVLYIRQSTMKQVYENNESTMRQYALREKLLKLGWQPENIIVIDCDLGQSGSGSSERAGFKELVAGVSNDEVGAIACLEPSRLARNSHDWNRLMEICSITQTVIVDTDGIYSFDDINDRMLLGLKGTMSEVELHFIRARLRGGALNKAKRGKYRIPLPVGYIYDEAGNVVKDPNVEVQAAIDLFFATFRQCGSATSMVAHYMRNGYKIPRNPANGFNNKELAWGNLSSTRALDILHNPAFAGIYAYGQRQTVPTIDGKKIRAKPVDEWHVYISGHHEGYISEAEFKMNEDKLSMNNTAKSAVPPTREGSALLQGICVCGVCGMKMSVRYRGPTRGDVHYYACDNASKHYGGEICQNIHGMAIDKSVSNLVLDKLTPLAISNAIKVENEIERRKSGADGYFAMKLERTQYEAALARKRYMNVDPSNRLVAFELEKIWNQKIAELAQAEEELKIHENSKGKGLADTRASELMTIPESVKMLWNSDGVSVKDKKRILRCLVEDVTLTKVEQTIKIGVHFKTGTSAMVECQNPPMGYTTWTTPDNVLDIIRRESTSHTREEIASLLNNEGCLSGRGCPITADRVGYIMRKYGIPSFQEHLRARGFLTAPEKARQLNIATVTLHKMKNSGMLTCDYVKSSGKGDYMFAP